MVNKCFDTEFKIDKIRWNKIKIWFLQQFVLCSSSPLNSSTFSFILFLSKKKWSVFGEHGGHHHPYWRIILYLKKTYLNLISFILFILLYFIPVIFPYPFYPPLSPFSNVSFEIHIYVQYIYVDFGKILRLVFCWTRKD